MSELIAEARVLVTPDTAGFRTLLVKEVAAASKGVTVPIPVTPVATAGPGLAGQQAALRGVNEEVRKGATDARNLAEEERIATKAAAEHARQLGGLSKGAGSAALNLVGLRGATLASTGPFLAGAAAAITFGKAVGLAAEFNKQLAVLQATSGATADQLAQVSEAAKQLGADVSLPGVSAIDATQAMTELSKAGLSVQESIDGARGVLQLATAAGIDNAAATELAASALNAFGLAGADATKVADVLANSANAAQGSISDIGLALQQSAAAGRQAGLTLQETVGILTEFARAGIKGSDAGTSLRVLLLRLINPSKQASEVIKELGLHIRDATGNINLGFFDEFARKTANLTRAERDRDAAIIAGQDAFRGLAILSREGGAALQSQIDNLDKSGTAADLAAARMTGLSGAVENLKNQLSTVGLSIGQSLTPSLTEIVSGAGVAVGALGDVIEKVKDLKALADKPTDFIINIIPQGAGGGEGGGFDQIRQDAQDLVTKPLPGLIFLSRAQKQLAKDQADLNAQFAKADLPKLVSGLNAAAGSSTKFDALVVRLKAMADSLQGGSEKTEEFRKSFDAFIAQLQTQSQNPITVPITLPKGLLDGTLGADAAKATSGGFANQLKNEDFGFSGFVASVNFEDQGAQGAKLFGAGWAKALPAAIQPATAAALSGLALARAQAGGNEGQELSILRERESTQQAFLDKLLARPVQDKQTVDLATKEANLLAQTRARIAAIISGQQAAATAAANQVTADAAKADQTFLQGLADARTNQQNLISKAAQTAGTQDDIQRTAALRALIVKQIKQIQDSGVDEKTKKAAIDALVSLRISTTTSLLSLRQADTKARDAAKQEGLDAQAALAQAEGNTKLQIQLINIQIAGINQQIAKGELLGAALNKAKAQRETLRQQREDIQNQRLADRTALAQSVFDLTGNKNPLVTALNAQIAETRADIAAAKKAGDSTVKLRTELNGFLLARKNLLKDADKASKEAAGFGSFEFMQRQQGFAANLLGNLIPGFATAGLVGNTSSATALQGRIEDPRTSMLGDDVLTGNRLNADRGVRPVQVDTTNALLRQILRTLNGKSNNPPEIQQNWRTAFAELDTL